MIVTCRSKRSCFAKNDRRGIIVPVVALLLAVSLMTAFTIASFGSNVRRTVTTGRVDFRIQNILKSALTEAQAVIESEDPGLAAVPLDSWWAQLLPPFDGQDPPEHSIDPVVVRREMGEDNLTISPVTLHCIHRDSRKGTAQGLLMAAATVRVKIGTLSERVVQRKVLLRYLVVSETDSNGITSFGITLQRAPLAVMGVMQ